MKIFICIILVFSFFSCNLSNNSFYEAYRWSGKKIVMENKMDVKILGKDTVVNFRDGYYKLLVYVSPFGCTECSFNAYGWKLVLDSLQKQQQTIEPWFVVSSKNYPIFELMCRDFNFKYPVFYDRNGDFGRINEFNYDKTVTVLLLDSLNRVKVVGDPVINKNIFKLYGEVMNGDLKE